MAAVAIWAEPQRTGCRASTPWFPAGSHFNFPPPRAGRGPAPPPKYLPSCFNGPSLLLYLSRCGILINESNRVGTSSLTGGNRHEIRGLSSAAACIRDHGGWHCQPRFGHRALPGGSRGTDQGLFGRERELRHERRGREVQGRVEEAP